MGLMWQNKKDDAWWGGMGSLAERLQRKWDCQHFAVEELHFSTIPYPVHSWMLVVVQRPWPLVGKVLVWLSRNRSAQFWDSPWKITELIRAKHTARRWGIKMDHFNMTISTIKNILDRLQTTSISYNVKFETTEQPIQIFFHKLL